MTTPRGLTQPDTSFIGTQYQGIHHAPFTQRTHTTTNTTPQRLPSWRVNTQKLRKTRNHITPHTNNHNSCPCAVHARVHYTVLTQHPTHTTTNHTKADCTTRASTRTTLMPQTPNNAPTYPKTHQHMECKHLRKKNDCTQPHPLGACVHPITQQ